MEGRFGVSERGTVVGILGWLAGVRQEFWERNRRLWILLEVGVVYGTVANWPDVGFPSNTCYPTQTALLPAWLQSL